MLPSVARSHRTGRWRQLANLPEDDDWILNANFIDKTFLRHVISYELFARMNPNNVASRCKYVELSPNSEYNGLYVLMEKLDKSSLNIKAKDSTSVIFKEPHLFRKSYDGIQPQRANNFHQQTFPKIGNRDQSSWLEGIREFILTSSDANFKTGISALFDINNIIDWHLLLLFSNNSDGILKNFYLYKIDANTPIRIAPWDYDHSFGRDGDNEMNLDKNPLKIERSILFARLLKFDWYKSKLKKRWKELNAENILSEDGLMKSILVKSQVVRDRALRNFEKWPVNSPIYYDDNNFDKEIEVMLTFVEIRHKRLRAYFKSI